MVERLAGVPERAELTAAAKVASPSWMADWLQQKEGHRCRDKQAGQRDEVHGGDRQPRNSFEEPPFFGFTDPRKTCREGGRKCAAQLSFALYIAGDAALLCTFVAARSIRAGRYGRVIFGSGALARHALAA